METACGYSGSPYLPGHTYRSTARFISTKLLSRESKTARSIYFHDGPNLCHVHGAAPSYKLQVHIYAVASRY